MKFRSIILAALASAAMLVSCEKPAPELGEPMISLDKTELTLDQAASSQTVALTATRGWKIDGQIPEWMTVNPNKGEGSNEAQTITIDVKANEGGNRTAALKFTIGLFDTTLKIAQAGPKGDAVDGEVISIKDFMEKKDKTTEYVVKGVASRVKFQETPGQGFGGFDLTDATGKMSCAFPANLDDFKANLKDGSVVTIKGKYNEHNGQGQMYKGLILKVEEGEALPEPEKPTSLKKISIKDFLAAKADNTTWYELTGKIVNIQKADYGNIDLEDATGKVYVYGITKDFVAKNDKSFSKLGLKVGDELTIGTLRAEFNGKPQAGGNQPAFYISHKPGEGGVTPDPEKPAPSDSKFASTIAWTLGAGAYDITSQYPESAKFNGEATAVSILKFGSSKKGGEATLTIPAGTKEISFYAFAWGSDKEVKAIFDVNGKVTEIALASNAGFSGNDKPYSITVADTDLHTLNVEGATTVKVSTPAGKKRFALAAVKATK